MIGVGDLTAIFASGDFDIAAVFTITPADPPTPAVTLSVRGIFTDSTEETNILSSQVETVNPTLACVTDQITTVKRGQSVAINAVNYTVERVERLGTGVSLVHLKT